MSRTVDDRGLRIAFVQVSSLVLFGVLPIAVCALVLIPQIDTRTFLYDFHGDLFGAGQAIIHGRNPYQAGLLSHLAAIARAGGRPQTTFAVPVYPAPDLLSAVPLALLPYRLAAVIFTLLGVAALAGGLWLFGVRDWRCYGAAFLSWPVVHSLRLGQVNELLVLGLAVIWRWRGRLVAPAAATAAVVVAKLFLWPVGAFLLFTRRWRTLGMAIALAAVVSLAAWAVIGFDGLSAYPRMLSDLSAVEGSAGVSTVSLGRAAGISHGLAVAGSVIATIVLLGLAWSSYRRSGEEERAFGLVVVAALAASPLVWPHYLVLIYVPIALLSPRLGPLWLVPLITYIAPVELTHGDPWRIIPYTFVELVVAVALAVPGLDNAMSRGFGKRRVAGKSAVRLESGLNSTSFRSATAVQRPTKGPEGPH